MLSGSKSNCDEFDEPSITCQRWSERQSCCTARCVSVFLTEIENTEMTGMPQAQWCQQHHLHLVQLLHFDGDALGVSHRWLVLVACVNSST